MGNVSRLISAIKKCSENYKFDIEGLELELNFNSDKGPFIKYTIGGFYKIVDSFNIKGIFQKARLRRIAEETREYFRSHGVRACSYSSESGDDSF